MNKESISKKTENVGVTVGTFTITQTSKCSTFRYCFLETSEQLYDKYLAHLNSVRMLKP
jgi:hypothetical protein